MYRESAIGRNRASARTAERSRKVPVEKEEERERCREMRKSRNKCVILHCDYLKSRHFSKKQQKNDNFSRMRIRSDNWQSLSYILSDRVSLSCDNLGATTIGEYLFCDQWACNVSDITRDWERKRNGNYIWPGRNWEEQNKTRENIAALLKEEEETISKRERERENKWNVGAPSVLPRCIAQSARYSDSRSVQIATRAHYVVTIRTF